MSSLHLRREQHVEHRSWLPEQAAEQRGGRIFGCWFGTFTAHRPGKIAEKKKNEICCSVVCSAPCSHGSTDCLSAP
jgi:hypothetical protein